MVTSSESYIPIRQKTSAAKFSQEMEISWLNYIVPVITSSILMAACWSIGFLGASFIWIILFIALYVIKTHVWIKRERRRDNLRSVILREREFVVSQFAQISDLPAWVQFPDVERIEWINKIIQQLWPYIGEYSKFFLREYIEPEVRAQMPALLKSFKFVSIDMGDIPCRVDGVKVYTQNVGRDKIIMDMDVVYAGDAEFVVNTCGCLGGMNQIVLSGRLRCVLSPLLSYPPMVGGVSGAFIELPKFDFNLTGMGEFVQVPGLIDAIRSFVNTQMASFAVLPNKVVVPLAPNVDITRLYLPDPDGIIRIKVLEARNLENKDISFLKRNKSDPYVEVKVGYQIFRTKTVDDDLNPIFNEYFEAVVDQASGQKLRFEVFDEDTAGADDELGRLTIPLEVVKNAGQIEKWYHLEGCKHGELKLHISWMDLCTDSNRDNVEEWLVDKTIHSALLMVFVDNVSNLPYAKGNIEPSPYVELSLGKMQLQRTPAKTKTINPLFQNKFMFFVKQPEGQELKVRAIDDCTKGEIGELIIPLLTLLNQPNMEIYQQTFFLKYGVHSSPIVLTARLRFFVSPDSASDPLRRAAGTHSHIERSTYKSSNSDDIIIPTSLAHANNSKLYTSNVTVSNENGSILPLITSTEDSQKIVEEIDSIPRCTSSHSIGASSSGRINSLRKRSSSSLFNRLGIHVAKRHSNLTIKSGIGQLHLRLQYDKKKFKLFVDQIFARGLIPIEENGRVEPYISMRLYDSNSKRMIKKKTAIVRSLNPKFQETMEFDVHSTALPSSKLCIIVKDSINYGLVNKPPILGLFEIDLKDYNPDEVISKWVDLTGY